MARNEVFPHPKLLDPPAAQRFGCILGGALEAQVRLGPALKSLWLRCAVDGMVPGRWRHYSHMLACTVCGDWGLLVT